MLGASLLRANTADELRAELERLLAVKGGLHERVEGRSARSQGAERANRGAECRKPS